MKRGSSASVWWRNGDRERRRVQAFELHVPHNRSRGSDKDAQKGEYTAHSPDGRTRHTSRILKTWREWTGRLSNTLATQTEALDPKKSAQGSQHVTQRNCLRASTTGMAPDIRNNRDESYHAVDEARTDPDLNAL